MTDPRHIILTGLSGSGKSTIGRRLARHFQLPLVDVDREIEAVEGASIPAIFSTKGEEAFREIEASLIRAAIQGPQAVISLGGGAVLHPTTRILCAGHRMIWLHADFATLARRVAPRGTSTSRPLLAGSTPDDRLRALYDQRRPHYAQAHIHLNSSGPLDQVAGTAVAALAALPPSQAQHLAIRTSTGQGATYDVLTGRGILKDLGSLLAPRVRSRRIFAVSDSAVWPIAGSLLMNALTRHGFTVHSEVVPSGEQSKTPALASRLWTWLAENAAERHETLLAFGGGVVGDLGGFVAATYLRGMPLVQVPTTLLSQVDSSIGGKVAVDHPIAKNLIGAFKTPDVVLVDTALLTSLPPRQVANGWAEVLKHGVILDAELFALMEREAAALSHLSPDLTLETVRRSLAIKASVVQEDEFEQGPRMLLNYGHTLGHAIEAAAGFSALLHGEAVSLGMVAAAWMSTRLGMLPAREFERIEHALVRLNLPVRWQGLDTASVLQAMQRDKKVRSGRPTWVLPTRIGAAVRTAEVPPDLAEQALQYVGRARTVTSEATV